MTEKLSPSEKRSGLGDTIFAFFHLILLIAVIIYAVASLVQGNGLRFAVIMVCLVLYYFLVLHKPVLKEIRRKRELKSSPPQRKSSKMP
jgi:Flp pilus assembly protein TadB